MEFPEDIKKNILSYFTHLYRKRLHLDVIKTSKEYRIDTYIYIYVYIYNHINYMHSKKADC